MTKTTPGGVRRERSDVETALESHWHRLLVKENEDGDKKIKEEVVKKNNLFRAPRCRQSSTTKGKRREKDTQQQQQQQQQQQHRLKPYTKTLTRTMDQFILECLNVDSKEDAANEKDGKTREYLAESYFEKFKASTLGIMNSAACSLFSTGKTRGLVLEIGDGVAHAVPVS